ncbi:Glutamate--tRNA ligase mitochondrial [Naganishia albida]|nr:Glutamate--tRNA ligase mitochondrial [Naganishia albida]
MRSSITRLTPRLRFAPSPTGYLHLGGLRTALFNHLLARKWKGKWILRIEDTDRTRLVKDAVQSLEKTLDWAGLDYDEGPSNPGSVGPYTQSERLDIYREHVKKLMETDHAYPCFCSKDELEAIRREQMTKKANTAYDGRCRHLTVEEVQRQRQAGQSFVVRFKTSPDPVDLPSDLIFGEYASSKPSTPDSESAPLSEFSPSSSSTLSHLPASTLSSRYTSAPKGHRGTGAFVNAHKDYDDFIILKADGFPTYHLASVVDDTLMGITHVFRGEEWLPSVTKHIRLYNAFGYTPPAFGHLPLLVNADGTKLSKRTGDVKVEDYIHKGYEPAALNNFLALMGWDHHHAPDVKPFFPPSLAPPSLSSVEIRQDLNTIGDLFTMPGLVESFDLNAINHKRAAVFLPKLDWINKMHLRRAGMIADWSVEKEGEGYQMGTQTRADLVDRLMEMLREKKVVKDSPLIEDKEYVGKVLDAELPRATVLQDIPDLSVFFFLSPKYDTLEAKALYATINRNFYGPMVSMMIKAIEEDTSLDWTEDNMWNLINALVKESGAGRGKVVTPLRHALTGRKSGPSLPAIMVVLGRERCLTRLRKGLFAWEQGRKGM